MHLARLLFIVLFAAFISGCTAPVQQSDGNQPALSSSDATTRYQQGLARYRDSKYDAALADLGAAANSGHLKTADTINARKHLAFIHCVSNREALCREQFQLILKVEPGFNLAANEANHPTWGPVWRSIKGAQGDQQAVQRGSGLFAGKAQQKLGEGIKEYDAGRYKEAIAALQAALQSGLSESLVDQVRAHKFLAFSYCLTRNAKLCGEQFRAIWSVDPAFELLPSERGHPAWASVYRKEKAASKASAKK